MAFQPFFILFVGVEIIENNLQPPVRILSHDFVHEFQNPLRRSPLQRQRTASWCRCACNRGSVPSERVHSAALGSLAHVPMPGLTVSRGRRGRPHYLAAPCKEPPHPLLWSRIGGRCSRTNSCERQDRFSACAENAIRIARRRRRAP